MATRITRAEFEAQYSRESGMSLEELREGGRETRPCGPEWCCDYEDCQGWQMAFVKEMQWAVDRGIALPVEKALLEWRAEW